MSKFNVKFLREFEVEIDADNVDTAQSLAHQILGQFPAGTCKLLSIIGGGIEAVAIEEPSPPPSKPWGRPNGGGSPGTPTIKVPVLVDQIAEAA